MNQRESWRFGIKRGVGVCKYLWGAYDPMMLNYNFWIPVCGRKGPMNQGLSLLPCFFLGNSLGLARQFFSESQYPVRDLRIIVHGRAGMGQKEGFQDILENLVLDFFGDWPVKKVHVTCCIPGRVLYLGNIWP